MNTGKYFESQFIKSFHATCNAPEWFIIRLKDIGKLKQADVGDYIVFHKDKVFAVELKARENGIIYPSEIKSDYMSKQLEKWLSFENKPNRISIYIIKNEKTKEIGIFLSDDIKECIKKERINEDEAKIKISFNNSNIPYLIKSFFENYKPI